MNTKETISEITKEITKKDNYTYGLLIMELLLASEYFINTPKSLPHVVLITIIALINTKNHHDRKILLKRLNYLLQMDELKKQENKDDENSLKLK